MKLRQSASSSVSVRKNDDARTVALSSPSHLLPQPCPWLPQCSPALPLDPGPNQQKSAHPPQTTLKTPTRHHNLSLPNSHSLRLHHLGGFTSTKYTRGSLYHTKVSPLTVLRGQEPLAPSIHTRKAPRYLVILITHNIQISQKPRLYLPSSGSQSCHKPK